MNKSGDGGNEVDNVMMMMMMMMMMMTVMMVTMIGVHPMGF